MKRWRQYWSPNEESGIEGRRREGVVLYRSEVVAEPHYRRESAAVEAQETK